MAIFYICGHCQVAFDYVPGSGGVPYEGHGDCPLLVYGMPMVDTVSLYIVNLCLKSKLFENVQRSLRGFFPDGMIWLGEEQSWEGS